MAIRIADVDVINDDRELVLAKLTDINETIADTAVDVFVYDTSKDSDGGAWRHRTQHTSWYAEASSASRDPNTRSTRAEFPAVAVIVAEASKVTIYDGDDPSLPMWMVFETNGIFSGSAYNSLAALNGVLVAGTSDGFGSPFCNFIADFGLAQLNASAALARSGAIVDRNTAGESNPAVTYTSVGTIVNSNVNDVAMTVLPDAPTDPATGLEIPTIAVATQGGVSVIKDDGTVVDSSNLSLSTTVAFNEDGDLFFQNIGYLRYARSGTYGSDGFGSALASSYSYGTSGLSSPKMLAVTTTADIAAYDGTLVDGDNFGLQVVAEDPTTPANGMVAYTTSDYATGWMPGDIKLAALADTTAETLSGEELVVDGSGNYWIGDFDVAADVDEWTETAGTASLSSGTIAVVNSAGVARIRREVTGLTVGQKYQFTIVCTQKLVNGDSFAHLGTTPGGIQYINNLTKSTPVDTITTHTFEATETSLHIEIGSASSGNTVNYDNISVRLADPDRSVNGNGLAAYGSITKAAVATGADVVGYSGFSSSNYLEQPNSIIPTGLNDLLIMGWMKRSSDRETIVSYEHPTAGNGFALLATWNGNGKLSLFTGRGSTNRLTTFDTVPSGVWNHFAVWRSNQIWYGAVNGVVSAIGVTADQDDFAVGGNLKVGLQSLITGNAFGGSLALLRISGTAPTADQIRKIYEDERPLFQEDAKATLTGTSDAVTALAHDPDTNLLHVGTSGGRSVFQGLRRVEEHTGTNSQSLAAISAVDGLVVEGK